MQDINSKQRCAFVRANVALSLCALVMTSVVLSQKAKEASAASPTSPTCPSIIGTANCPSGTVDQGFTSTVTSTCRRSAAFYDPLDIFYSNPYYGCCTYAQRFRQCYNPSTNTTAFQSVEYIRAKSAGRAACIPNETGATLCLSA